MMIVSRVWLALNISLISFSCLQVAEAVAVKKGKPIFIGHALFTTYSANINNEPVLYATIIQEPVQNGPVPTLKTSVCWQHEEHKAGSCAHTAQKILLTVLNKDFPSLKL